MPTPRRRSPPLTGGGPGPRILRSRCPRPNHPTPSATTGRSATAWPSRWPVRWPRSQPTRASTWMWTRPRSTWSARPGASTGTGRPTSPWSRPSGRAPIPVPSPPPWSRCSSGRLPDHVVGIELAGPGFINFRLDDGWLHEALAAVLAEGEDDYARPDVGHGETVQVEFISANPTGPIHVGNGWWGSYGDSLARVLARSGHRVSHASTTSTTPAARSAPSARACWPAPRGRRSPKAGTRAQYVTDLAAEYDGPDDVTAAGRWAADRILEQHPGHARLGGHRLRRVVLPGLDRGERCGGRDDRPARGARDSSTSRTVPPGSGPSSWATSATGCSARRTGTPPTWPATSPTTATSSSCAASTGSSTCSGPTTTDRWPASWPASRPWASTRVASRSSSARWSRSSTVTRPSRWASGPATPSTSTRSSPTSGPDATRILSLMSSLDQAATFDLATVREQSAENPVFYVQMASARIGGVGRKAAERGIVRAPVAEVDLSLLTHPRELEVLRCLEELPEVVADAAVDRAPTKVTTWVRRLASYFHGFYHDCPILADDVDPAVAQARLWLVEGARIGLAIGLGLLGRVRPGGHVSPRPDRAGRPLAAARGRPATADDGRLSIGGCDLVDLAATYGTPLFVYDEAHLRVRLPRGGRGLGRRGGLCHQGLPVRGHGPPRPRGGDVPRRLDRGRAARGPDRRRAGRPAGAPRQQQVDRGAGRRPVGRRRADRRRLVRRDRPDRAPGGRPAGPDRRSRGRGAGGPVAPEGTGPHHPGGRGPHPRVRPHRPGGLQVRLRPDLGCRRPGPSSGSPRWTPPVSSSSSASTPTSAARSSPSSPSPRPSTCWPSSSLRSDCPSWWSAAGSGVAYVNGEEAPPMAQWAGSVRRACRKAGIPDDGPGHRRARPVDRGRRRGDPLPGRARSRTCPGTGPTCRSTGG